jgi:hypothetical protein
MIVSTVLSFVYPLPVLQVPMLTAREELDIGEKTVAAEIDAYFRYDIEHRYRYTVPVTLHCTISGPYWYRGFAHFSFNWYLYHVSHKDQIQSCRKINLIRHIFPTGTGTTVQHFFF